MRLIDRLTGVTVDLPAGITVTDLDLLFAQTQTRLLGDPGGDVTFCQARPGGPYVLEMPDRLHGHTVLAPTRGDRLSVTIAMARRQLLIGAALVPAGMGCLAAAVALLLGGHGSPAGWLLGGAGVLLVVCGATLLAIARKAGRIVASRLLPWLLEEVRRPRTVVEVADDEKYDEYDEYVDRRAVAPAASLRIRESTRLWCVAAWVLAAAFAVLFVLGFVLDDGSMLKKAVWPAVLVAVYASSCNRAELILDREQLRCRTPGVSGRGGAVDRDRLARAELVVDAGVLVTSLHLLTYDARGTELAEWALPYRSVRGCSARLRRRSAPVREFLTRHGIACEWRATP